ncbi:MAG: MotA/TolQ/ExbB proton channel family protein [Candidatus Omnitrophica bacterium]|nr:MotA/TolQ/ExbB proton channel family protein [Candidatus Omnitrophota bacterium]MBU4479588.1 MotA/TolQ/ExbB proton channel family protein [Candidatus Omnitrophota bacterium]MCG2703722.1 MotA/TolQ/ExbB proton channel family protein [Candidatus Omnitrophota bacterium]
MQNVVIQLLSIIASCGIATGLYLKIDMLNKGGPVMVPIILCSIFALAIIMERITNLYRSKIDTTRFMDEITAALKRNRIPDALEICEHTQGPIAHILKAGISRHDRSRQEIREAIEDAGVHEVPKLEKNLSALATIAHVSPLLGLLGTVTGMVNTFQIIQQRTQSMYPVDPSVLAKGIWEALITTVAGLIVAIPSFVAYNYLVAKAENLVVEMEIIATDLVNILTQRR